MVDLILNHIAVVRSGRANFRRGDFPKAAIRDSAVAYGLSTFAKTDERVEAIVETTRRLAAIADAPASRRARAADAIPFRDRGATRLDQLASELAEESGDDGDSYGRRLRNCLGRDVVSGVAAFKEADAAEPGDGVRRATDGTDDDEAAATFEATCRARFSEGQR